MTRSASERPRVHLALSGVAGLRGEGDRRPDQVLRAAEAAQQHPSWWRVVTAGASIGGMSSRPRLEATSVSISTPRPRELAGFYADLLGVVVAASEGPRPGEPAAAGWAQLRSAEGKLRMTINLEWDPDFVPPVWPGTAGEQQPQMHLDVWVDDLDQAEAWAVECGARRHTHQPQEGVRVMLDPDGHPFCLFLG